MLRRMGRHPNRPGHMHMMLNVPGHERLVTHLFVSDSPYLDSDAVFGVRNSLIVDFAAHPAGLVPSVQAARMTLAAAPDAMQGAVAAGTVYIFFGNVSDVLELAKGGKSRLLALSTEQRVAQRPEVPTVSETIPGFVMTGWIDYFAPTGTPQSIIDRVSKALIEICREPDAVSILANAGIDTVGNTPEEFAAVIKADLPIMRSAVEAAGLLQK